MVGCTTRTATLTAALITGATVGVQFGIQPWQAILITLSVWGVSYGMEK